jgi:hypothetical protein
VVELGLEVGEPFGSDDDVLRHGEDLYSISAAGRVRRFGRRKTRLLSGNFLHGWAVWADEYRHPVAAI